MLSVATTNERENQSRLTDSLSLSSHFQKIKEILTNSQRITGEWEVRYFSTNALVALCHALP